MLTSTPRSEPYSKAKNSAIWNKVQGTPWQARHLRTRQGCTLWTHLGFTEANSAFLQDPQVLKLVSQEHIEVGEHPSEVLAEPQMADSEVSTRGQNSSRHGATISHASPHTSVS